MLSRVASQLKNTLVPGYRLLSSTSTGLKLKDNHYQTPCMCINMGHRYMCAVLISVYRILAFMCSSSFFVLNVFVYVCILLLFLCTLLIFLCTVSVFVGTELVFVCTCCTFCTGLVCVMISLCTVLLFWLTSLVFVYSISTRVYSISICVALHHSYLQCSAVQVYSGSRVLIIMSVHSNL